MIKRINEIRLIDINENNWKLSKCTCWWFSNHNICKHFIGISKSLGKCDFPPKSLQIPIGQKRKQGRPKENTPALIFQPIEIQSNIFNSHTATLPVIQDYDEDLIEDLQPKEKRTRCEAEPSREQPTRRA
jgi:hypothetical protein